LKNAALRQSTGQHSVSCCVLIFFHGILCDPYWLASPNGELGCSFCVSIFALKDVTWRRRDNVLFAAHWFSFMAFFVTRMEVCGTKISCTYTSPRPSNPLDPASQFYIHSFMQIQHPIKNLDGALRTCHDAVKHAVTRSAVAVERLGGGGGGGRCGERWFLKFCVKPWGG
jgi:hypothetical protein